MKKACIIGWPVAHSRSPLIHGYWLRHYGIAGSYTLEPVEPEHLPQFIKAMSSLGFVGANVTVPHKEAVFRLADERDAAAVAIGAANTVWFDDSRLCASNTDAEGFLASLDEQTPEWDAKGTAAVWGAGGAARAVLHALLARGFGRIVLANRSRERADILARAFGPAVEPVDWGERAALLQGCSLLVNATSLGMTGAAPLDANLSSLPGDAVVTDLVYDPLETALLRTARERGNRVADGLGMLLHQAAPGFERWFGVRPAITEGLRRLVADDLLAKARAKR